MGRRRVSAARSQLGVLTSVGLCWSAVTSQEDDMGPFDAVEPLEESTTSLVSSSTSAYSSFPVDVVVYVRVQVSGCSFLDGSCLKHGCESVRGRHDEHVNLLALTC